MYSDGDCVMVKRLANGYNITCKDPKIVAANKKRDAKPYDSKDREPYKDPEKTYTFKNLKEVTAWLTANLETALPVESYDSAFETCSAAMIDD